jgi:hypothetical protein
MPRIESIYLIFPLAGDTLWYFTSDVCLCARVRVCMRQLCIILKHIYKKYNKTTDNSKVFSEQATIKNSTFRYSNDKITDNIDY